MVFVPMVFVEVAFVQMAFVEIIFVEVGFINLAFVENIFIKMAMAMSGFYRILFGLRYCLIAVNLWDFHQIKRGLTRRLPFDY